ncbi:metallophosphoesterase [Streptomyces phaeochromogenes]|uniref:Metallophosphoesterase n=1 Tax=Streptomyces phaeochromogenes TaxID=1923 RepID=A0ABZ1HNY6_STRPH|nr:metallophosphoesterase [Streptomyces phaeochromogenes]WSD19734.1 metallophosphoesterase [Streptomyces phaeochromogenes]
MVVIFVVVSGVVLALYGALHWYAWRRLVRDTTAKGSLLRRAGSVAFVAGPLLSIAGMSAEGEAVPFLLQRILAWPGYLWMALFLYLLLALLVGEVVRPVLRRWFVRRSAVTDPRQGAAPAAQSAEAQESDSGAEELVSAGEPLTAPAHLGDSDAARGTAGSVAVLDPPPTPAASSTPTDPSRRLFVSRVVGGTAAAVTVATVGQGTYGLLRGPRVKRLTVPLARLPRSAHGFRIAVVSDIHVGPVLGRAFAQRVVDTVNATQPDLIAVVGDLVDGSVENLTSAVEPLVGLRARHGAYFVTGNHEYISGAEPWIEKVRELGLRPLENARTELPGFDLAGVNDVRGEEEGQGPDFGKALGDRDRSRTAVLLAHQPVVIEDAVRHGVDLQLSGHTHGGQLWPGNYLAELANPTVAGLERYGDTQLYVSRGAGAWGPPVRVGAPSDITVIELASRQA